MKITGKELNIARRIVILYRCLDTVTQTLCTYLYANSAFNIESHYTWIARMIKHCQSRINCGSDEYRFRSLFGVPGYHFKLKLFMNTELQIREHQQYTIILYISYEIIFLSS